MNADKVCLLEKNECLPDHFLKQVLDFVDFLMWQQNPTCPPGLHSDNAPYAEDSAWLNADLSKLSAHEPYK